MKHFKKIELTFFIFLIGLFLFSCTNENQNNQITKDNITNQKEDSLTKVLMEKNAELLYEKAQLKIKENDNKSALKLLDSIIVNYNTSKVRREADSIKIIITPNPSTNNTKAESTVKSNLKGVCKYKMRYQREDREWSDYFKADYSFEFYSEELAQTKNMRKFTKYYSVLKIFNKARQSFFKDRPNASIVIEVDSRNPMYAEISICDLLEHCRTIHMPIYNGSEYENLEIFSLDGDCTIYSVKKNENKYFKVLIFDLYNEDDRSHCTQYDFVAKDTRY